MQRRRLRVSGTVQGVGFRPFVYRQAVALGLRGTVANAAGGVMIEVEGPSTALDELARRLRDEPPPQARVGGVEVVSLAPLGDDDGFRIVASSGAEPDLDPAVVSVDLGTCTDCLAEVLDPDDRRHRYPFTNCTNCGPRYTIVRAVPYDRTSTTMASFTMCEQCRAEYEDPSDRRFHAQPNACAACGPRLAYELPGGGVAARGDSALREAAAALVAGGVLAVKGIGGYHLAVDATSEVAVGELRRRKRRDDKPFAVMVTDLAAAERMVVLTAEAGAALTSPRRPVVLAPRRAGATVAPGVAPGLPDLGVVVAYTPLHHLLLVDAGRPLVMTSANLVDEPIAHRDDDARSRLAPLVDGLLTHDRAIHVSCEDSVVRATDRGLQVLRRGRGYAPEPVALPPALAAAPAAGVLAVGAEVKSTVSVARGGLVVTSPHLGDLEHPAALDAFTVSTRHLSALYGVAPEVVAHDRHPEYLSTKWARDTDLPTMAVQHHHAHVASCLVEHGRVGPVVGVAFDGLGLGLDGGLWGGEILVADLVAAERVGHLRPVALPGGSRAIREPWRMAVAWAHQVLGCDAALEVGAGLDRRATDLVALLDRGGVRTTTSAGRLFDAVAALLGVRSIATYEGQAAVELEALARPVPPSEAPRYEVVVDREGPVGVLDPAPMIAAVIAARAMVEPVASIAAGAHDAVGRATADLTAEVARTRGLATVVLTGGVFQNVRLTEVVAGRLERAGLEVLLHGTVPPNDGGISLGQAAIALAHLAPLPSSLNATR